jgi:hypothetical protein
MSKSDGTPLTLEEGTAVLENVGVAISHAWYPDEGAKSLHSLDGGIFVQMKYYDAGRAAQQVRIHSVCLLWHWMLTDTRPCATRGSINSR